MASIKPTFTLTANKNSANANPGPLSVALSLSASDLLTVDNVQSEIVEIDNHDTEDNNATRIIDGSLHTSGAASTTGGFIFMKNVSADSTTNYIMIGIEAEGVVDGSLADISDASDDKRLFTLKVGEFAFFPFDYNFDITARANVDDQKLEYWIFDRG
tara:strand:+ start:65 stop:538 length:474 start_codon:yes stop_codon:yes gene_type:complete